jgi:excisionase family DNA binding protein
MQDEMLTVKEVATELKLSERFITQEITKGNLTAVKFGKTYRIYRSELNRYIKERTTKKEE